MDYTVSPRHLNLLWGNQQGCARAHKGAASQNPGHLPVEFQVPIHKPLYVPAFASASLASHCFVRQRTGPASQSIKQTNKQKQN